MATTRATDDPGLPVRTVRVAVISGPDRGRSAEADAESLSIGTARSNDLVLTDNTVSGFHLELTAAPGRIRVTDNGSTNGVRCGGVLIESGLIDRGTVLQVGETQLRVDAGAGDSVDLHDSDVFGALVGRTPRMRRLFAQLSRAAPSTKPVLLTGESGTGKEVVAKALHDASRRSGPLVTVDCGALSPALIASELFGHERGAFTGAVGRHEGAFERAHGGTLFLDEVGELPAPLQPVLLGALERGRIRRVGGREELSVDVRVIAATHRDLRRAVNDGSFRLDLYYRIAVVVLTVPALRERPEDIPILVAHFLAEEGAPSDALSEDVLKRLTAHSWPGNVRELRNVVEATLVMGEAPALESNGEPPQVAIDPGLLELTYKDARGTVVRAFEEAYLPRLLDRAKGNVSKAGRIAEMDRTYLLRLLAKHRLK